jgi:hypothetical protein
MNRIQCIVAVVCVCLTIVFTRGLDRLPQTTAQAQAVAAPVADQKVQVEQLQAEVKKLNDLIPDQAAVMSHLSYHFANLWFAAKDEHWDLADFYLSETRSNLRWAARVKPKRKDLEGKETVDIVAIAQAMDNGPFTDLKKAIVAKDKTRFVKLYNDTLSGCYACHKASFKPYLRPQIPEAPESRMINFDPKAKTPE